MPCPIDISHGGVSLSPLSLFTLLTAIATHTHPRPLLFRQDEHEFSIYFRPSLAVFTPNEAANVTEHPSSFCHFQGANADGFRAWLSACRPDRIEMTLHAPFASYKLKQENGTFSLVSSGAEYCDLLRAHLSKRGVAPFKSDHYLPDYYKKYQHLFVRKRFVEFAMFGDYSLFVRYDRDEAATKNIMLTALHMVNSYYDSLNIEFRLVHMSILDSPSHIDFKNDDTVLDSFGKYLEQWDTLHYDTANLMIGGSHHEEEDFDGHDVANTLAHELGHLLGMAHDEEKEHQNCACPTDYCIMTPDTVDGHVQYWSGCSLSDLEVMYKSNADYCLWDEPGKTIDNAACGNGVVEDGEECDCGPMGCITHDCCDASTCKLRAGAQCAFGSCCDVTTCSILTAARMCRDAKNTCDLPDYCDGVSVECPADKHRPDGERCPDDNEAICYDGRCGSRKLQCRELWGEDTKLAAESCYDDNKCFTESRTGIKGCAQEDKLCGFLFCSVRKVPEKGHVRGWIYRDSEEASCLAMYVAYQNDFMPDYYMGMTPEGTTCGEGKICLQSKCVASPLAPPYIPLPAPKRPTSRRPRPRSAGMAPHALYIVITTVVIAKFA